MGSGGKNKRDQMKQEIEELKRPRDELALESASTSVKLTKYRKIIRNGLAHKHGEKLQGKNEKNEENKNKKNNNN